MATHADTTPNPSPLSDLHLAEESSRIYRLSLGLFLMIRGFSVEAGLAEMGTVVDCEAERLCEDLDKLRALLEERRLAGRSVDGATR